MNGVKWSPENLKALDDYLRDHSYVEGWRATHSDGLLIRAVEPVIKSLVDYVHITRWWKHIQTFQITEFQGMARTMEEVVSKFGTTSKTVSLQQ